MFFLGSTVIFLGYVIESTFMLIFGYFIILLGILFVFAFIREKIKNRIYEKKLQIAILNSGINQIDNLNPYEFEEWVARMFRLNRFKAMPTKRSGDYGVDVIAEKDNERIAIQVKKFSKPVGIKAVQEVIAGMDYYNCYDGWVITTAPYFTQASKNLAHTRNIKLYNKNDLALLLNEIQKNNELNS